MISMRMGDHRALHGVQGIHVEAARRAVQALRRIGDHQDILLKRRGRLRIHGNRPLLSCKS
jgi:hypothetical protein